MKARVSHGDDPKQRARIKIRTLICACDLGWPGRQRVGRAKKGRRRAPVVSGVLSCFASLRERTSGMDTRRCRWHRPDSHAPDIGGSTIAGSSTRSLKRTVGVECRAGGGNRSVFKRFDCFWTIHMLIHCGHSVGMVLFVILFQDGGSFCSTLTELPHVMSTAYH